MDDAQIKCEKSADAPSDYLPGLESRNPITKDG